MVTTCPSCNHETSVEPICTVHRRRTGEVLRIRVVRCQNPRRKGGSLQKVCQWMKVLAVTEVPNGR